MAFCLHLLNSYLPQTETFIWQYLSHAKEFRPILLSAKQENLGRFPLPQAIFPKNHPSQKLWASLTARLTGRYAQASYRDCLEEVRSYHPSLIHVHNGYRACVSIDFTDGLRLPKIVNFYGSDLTHVEFLRRARWGYRHLFKTAEAFLVEGPSMHAKLSAQGCPEPKIRMQRIAINPLDYPYRERTWDGNRPIRFLFVGRLVEKKGLEWGLRALALCRQDFPWELTVVGDGPLRKSLEALAVQLRIDAQVKILGYRSLQEMRAEMQTHDVQFQPSCTALDGDGEGGAPTVLLEAQACGMPVLSTFHDDIPYVTSPGKSAFLCPEKNPSALSENIRKLVEQAQQWPEMARAGRAHIEAQHDVRQEAGTLETLYRELSGR